MVGILFYELENNSRLVGGIDPESTKKVAELYRTVVKGKVVQTDATTAEFVKIIENTYRDINIAFANELAKYAESIGVNVWEAIDAANQHPRVHIHRPGPGVGGECIAVDPLFLLDNKDVDMPLVRTARQENDSMPGVRRRQDQGDHSPERYFRTKGRHLRAFLQGERLRCEEQPLDRCLSSFGSGGIALHQLRPTCKTWHDPNPKGEP